MSKLTRKQIEDLKNDKQEKFLKGSIITKKKKNVRDSKIR